MRLFRRKSKKPRVLKVLKIEIPLSPRVELKRKELFSIAQEYDSEIFETRDSYLLILNPYVFIARKKRSKP